MLGKTSNSKLIKRKGELRNLIDRIVKIYALRKFQDLIEFIDIRCGVIIINPEALVG